jgi:Tfp pilus assembly protein PilF/mono/diheme cytochrome c family protein
MTTMIQAVSVPPFVAIAAALASPLIAQDAAPTWSRDIAPLVHRACAVCHHPGQPAPFSLLTYDDVWKRRAQIVEVTQQRVMPPWLVVHGEFADDRRLRDDEIALLKRWADAGAPRGDAAHEPAPPQFATGWSLREPDLVVIAPDVVDVPAAGPDRVRNLVLPITIDRLRYVEAVEIQPHSRAVHHAILGVDATRESRRLDAQDEEPGFPGMTPGAALPPDGHFLGWTPGKSVRRSPPGQAWRLRPGDDFVLQLHLVPTGKPERVQPVIGLYFTEVPTTTTFVPVVLFDDRIDIAPGARDFTARDHLDLPVPVVLHAIYPHAHWLCRRMRGTATLPGGEQRVLFGIDAWDFDWQDDYRFATPIELPAGTRLEMEYGFDNSEHNPNNPNRPPQRVRFGQASADEMATLTIAVTLADTNARKALEMADVARQLEKVPDAWNVLLHHARLARERGDFAAAQRSIERARTISPGAADCAIESGLLAEAQGRTDDARRDYEAALRLDPERGLAHLQLGALLGRQGRGEEAFAHFEQAMRTLPNAPIVHANLGTAHFQLGRLREAATHYERAVALDPDYFGPWFNLGRVRARLGDEDGARTALQRAAALRPGDARVQSELETLGK